MWYSLRLLLAGLLCAGLLACSAPPAPVPAVTGALTASETVEATGQVALPIVVNGTPSPPPPRGGLVQPGDLTYLGAFRLPEEGERPLTFQYGGSAMTYRPSGDASGPADGFPGSLYVSGHDRLPYGELPDGGQIAEVSIPAPVIGALESLPRAELVQPFSDVARGAFGEYEEIPRMGMQYLEHPDGGGRVHLAYGQHLVGEDPGPTHAWFDLELIPGGLTGFWFVGEAPFSTYSVNGYMLAIPAEWARAHTQGRPLGTGRYRDGGWAGMGPALYAYQPWTDDAGTPAAPGARLMATTLLQYETSLVNDSLEHALRGYQHPDEWEGAAWLSTASGKEAVLFAGTKSVGAKYWYGYANPAGPDAPCVDEDMVGLFTVCRLADGSPCPAEDLTECEGHPDYRGWWSTRFTAQLLFYDPADLARVAAGEMEAWAPQPYAVLDIDERLLHNPAGVEADMLGVGVQRRFRIGEAAFDEANGLLYVLELFADEAAPVVHVWRVGI